jgi:hypothetical protein
MEEGDALEFLVEAVNAIKVANRKLTARVAALEEEAGIDQDDEDDGDLDFEVSDVLE